jgi:hypothetical protein
MYIENDVNLHFYLMDENLEQKTNKKCYCGIFEYYHVKILPYCSPSFRPKKTAMWIVAFAM